MPPIDLDKYDRCKMMQFLNSFDTIATACDGVLWRNDEVVSYAPELMTAFKNFRKKTFYMADGLTLTKQQVVEKCQNLKFPATEDEILYPSQKVVRYLKNQGFKGKVYVIGNSTIAAELENAGIPYYGIGLDPIVNIDSYFFQIDRSVKAVIVGHDEHFSFRKMLKAATYLKDPKVLFIGNNTRQSLSMNCSSITECEGIIRSIEECTERKATLIDSESNIYETITSNRTVIPHRTLIMSDRVDIDIRLGNQAGFKTLLVTDIEDGEERGTRDTNLIPNYYIKSLENLYRYVMSCTNYKPYVF